MLKMDRNYIEFKKKSHPKKLKSHISISKVSLKNFVLQRLRDFFSFRKNVL